MDVRRFGCAGSETRTFRSFVVKNDRQKDLNEKTEAQPKVAWRVCMRHHAKVITFTAALLDRQDLTHLDREGRLNLHDRKASLLT